MKLLAESQDYVRGGTQKATYSPEDVIEVTCPLCDGDRRERVYTEHAVVGISRCRDCSLVYTSPRLREPEKIYWGDESAYYREAALIFEGKRAHHRDPNYLTELAMIERHVPRGRLLDVGCNMGMLLRLASRRGWEVQGVEPSPSLAALAGRHQVPVVNAFLHDLGPEHENAYDVVALSDVFEHVTRPREFLRDVDRVLRRDGLVYVKVPNVRWSLAKQRVLGALGRRPAQGLWDSYEHVVHYSDDSLSVMLRRCGYEPVEIGIDPPIQTPNWHEFVGHYYQYPTPFWADPGRKTIRAVAYWISLLERSVSGRVGALAPNVTIVARRSGSLAEPT